MNVDRSRAGIARDRVRTIVPAWPADMTAAGLAIATAASAEEQLENLGIDPTEFADAVHTHAQSDVTGLEALLAALPAAQVTVDPAAWTGTAFEGITNLQTFLNTLVTELSP